MFGVWEPVLSEGQELREWWVLKRLLRKEWKSGLNTMRNARRAEVLTKLTASPHASRDLGHRFLRLREVAALGTGRTIFLPFTQGPRGFVLSWSAIKAFAAASRGVSEKRLMGFAMPLLCSLGSVLVFTGYLPCFKNHRFADELKVSKNKWSFRQFIRQPFLLSRVTVRYGD